MSFNWDDNKSKSNKTKHGIDFGHAKDIFSDPNAIVDKGKTINGEKRLIAIGKTLKLFIITVVFTMRDATIRIIPARQARKNEIKEYISSALKEESDDK